jgi:hypothetical protein
MTVTDAQYARAVVACLGACLRWRKEHPDARLKFNARWYPASSPGRGVICSLSQAIAMGAGGNGVTRELLMAMHDATPGGATIAMAEAAVFAAYGIPHALTRAKN